MRDVEEDRARETKIASRAGGPAGLGFTGWQEGRWGRTCMRAIGRIAWTSRRPEGWRSRARGATVRAWWHGTHGTPMSGSLRRRALSLASSLLTSHASKAYRPLCYRHRRKPASASIHSKLVSDPVRACGVLSCLGARQRTYTCLRADKENAGGWQSAGEIQQRGSAFSEKRRRKKNRNRGVLGQALSASRSPAPPPPPPPLPICRHFWVVSFEIRADRGDPGCSWPRR